MLDRLKRDGWVPYAKSIGTAAVAAVVLAVSAVRLVALAEQCHIDSTLSWTLPVALDVGGAVATIIWTKGTGVASQWGMLIALLSLAESLAGNILSDLIQAGLLAVTPQLIIGVGAVYPITLFLMIHLLVQSGGKQRASRTIARPEPKRAEAVRQPVNVETQKTVTETAERKQIESPKPQPEVADLRPRINKIEAGYLWFRDQVITEGRAPQTVSGREIDDEFGTKDYLKKHITAYRVRLAKELDVTTTTGTAVAGE